MCAPLCCKNLCCPSHFCAGGRGAGGSRSKNLLQGAIMQMLVQGHSETPARSSGAGHQQHPEPENQDSQHMLNRPRGLSLKITPNLENQCENDHSTFILKGILEAIKIASNMKMACLDLWTSCPPKRPRIPRNWISLERNPETRYSGFRESSSKVTPKVGFLCGGPQQTDFQGDFWATFPGIPKTLFRGFFRVRFNSRGVGAF